MFLKMIKYECNKCHLEHVTGDFLKFCARCGSSLGRATPFDPSSMTISSADFSKIAMLKEPTSITEGSDEDSRMFKSVPVKKFALMERRIRDLERTSKEKDKQILELKKMQGGRGSIGTRC